MDSAGDSGLRELLRDAGCGVLAVAGGRVELVNPALLTLFGLRSDDDGGDARCRDDNRWDDREGAPARDLVTALAACLRDDTSFRAHLGSGLGPIRAVTEDVTTLDGRTLECDYQPAGSGGWWLVLAWDVSPDRAEEAERIRRQRAEIVAGRLGARAHRARADEAERTGRRLAARNEELTATDAARVELLATASHELRTPLTSILNFSELLADGERAGGAADGQVAQYVEIVHRNARRLLDTVEDLLMLAGLGSEQRPSGTAPLDLEAAIRQLVADLGPTSTSAGVGITLDLTPGLTVNGVSDELVRMVGNVVDNAIKYSDPRTTVRIATDLIADAEGELARLVVADQGIGIPADEVDSVFGQFYRASTARASDRPGTGLGLAIAQGVAARHGGTIAVTSTLGEGTTVTIELPLEGRL